MRAYRAALVAMAMVAASTGCNLILDNDVHELSPDAAAGGQGGASTGGQGGIAGLGGFGGIGIGGIAGIGGLGIGGVAGITGVSGTGGVGGTGGGVGGTGGAGGTGGVGGTGGAGGTGGITDRDAAIDGSAGAATRDATVGEAGGAGDAGDAPAAPDGSVQDAPYDAADACTPNSTECRNRSVYLCTPGGQWVEILQCSAACVTGACTGSCVPGTKQCIGTTPQTCDNSGVWQSGSACPFVCTQGMCTGTCVPGNTITCGDFSTCNAGAYQTCDTTGTLGPCTPAPSNCATVPAGWNPVAMATVGTCPSGFDNPQTVYKSVTGAPFTCSCGCSGTQACEGSVTLYEADDCASSAQDWRSLPVTTSCVMGGYGSIVGGKGYTLGDIAFGLNPPTCDANPTPIGQPPLVMQTETICTPNQLCTTGACLTASQEAGLCISQPGMHACPAGYPKPTVYSTDYSDTRWCGGCTCGSSLSCGALSDVLLNNDSISCSTSHGFWMTASTSCAKAPSSFPLNAIKGNATSAGSGSCTETSPSNPTGGVELAGWGITTMCCK